LTRSPRTNCVAGRVCHSASRRTEAFKARRDLRAFRGNTATEHPALANDVFDCFELTFEDDEEAWLFPFADEPLARLERNVGRASREAATFLFLDTCK
jgi:hypothetical protein